MFWSNRHLRWRGAWDLFLFIKLEISFGAKSRVLRRYLRCCGLLRMNTKFQIRSWLCQTSRIKSMLCVYVRGSSCRALESLYSVLVANCIGPTMEIYGAHIAEIDFVSTWFVRCKCHNAVAVWELHVRGMNGQMHCITLHLFTFKSRLEAVYMPFNFKSKTKSIVNASILLIRLSSFPWILQMIEMEM